MIKSLFTKLRNDDNLTSFMVLIFICLSGLFTSLALVFIYGRKFDLYNISNDVADWAMLSSLMSGVLGPVIALWTLFITGWIAFEFNQYQKKKIEKKDNQELQQITIELYKEFRSERVLNTRRTVARIREVWKADRSGQFLEKLVKHLIVEKEFIYDNRTISRADIQAVFDLFAFYKMLSLYSNNNNNICNLSYFYYGWWRSFLYAIAFKYDDGRKNILFAKADVPKAFKDHFIQNVELQAGLKRLDVVCGFDVLGDTAEGKTIIEFYDNEDYLQ